MVKKIIFICALLFCVTQSFGQADSSTHGNNSFSWRIYDTQGPVSAFSLGKNKIWYSTGDKVGMQNLRSNQSIQHEKFGKIPTEGVVSIVNDGKGTFYFGGSNGLIKYKKGKATLYTTKEGLGDNNVQSILYLNGTLWVGTANGLSSLNGSKLTMHNGANGPAGNNIRGLASDEKNRLWIATDKGVTVYSGSWKSYTTTDGLSSDDVKAIGYDKRKKTLWIAVGEMDVNSFDGNEWSTYMDIQEEIVSVMTDTQSRIWFGTNGNGVMKYNGFGWVTDPKKLGFAASVVKDMRRNGKGDLFFATETGLLHMDNPYPF